MRRNRTRVVSAILSCPHWPTRGHRSSRRRLPCIADRLRPWRIPRRSLRASQPNLERAVLLASAFGFAQHWPERLGPAEVAAWRRSVATNVFHYAENRHRKLGYQLLSDGERFEVYPDFSQPALLFHGKHDDTVPVAIPKSSLPTSLTLPSNSSTPGTTSSTSSITCPARSATSWSNVGAPILTVLCPNRH